MFCEPSPKRRTGSYTLRVLAILLPLSWACGHKEQPFPPPLRHPATTKDLVAQQRGEEIILSFTYPQTTVSGTPLEPLLTVEYWQLDRAVPQWVAPEMETELDAVEVGSLEGASPPPEDEASAVDTGSAIFEGLAGSGDDPSRPDAPVASKDLSETAEGGDVADAEVESAEEDDEVGEEESEVLPPPRPPTKEELLAVDKREFFATATVRTTLEGPALTAAMFGDRIILTLPIEAAIETIDETASPEAAEPEAEPREDVTPIFERGSTFAIKTSVGPKLASELSNIAVLGRRTAPEPPGAFSLEPSPDKITLRWQVGDSGLLGFHVYRRDAQNPTYGPPLAFVPLANPVIDEAADSEDAATGENNEEADEPQEREYTDRTALYGQRYIYALTAVSHRTPVVESAIAVEREVDYADRFAPSAPKSLIALAESGRVRLLWNASPQSDVIGYTVSRRQGDGAFEPLHAEPITELEYSDRDVRSRQTYAYQVVAIDGEDNVSTPSETVEVRAP